jgi:uncharacterized protein (DUF4415 family)
MSAHDMNKPSTTNWERVDALTDETIDTSDIPPLTEEQLTRAILRMPREPIAVTVHIDPEVLAWFKAQGPDYERCMNAALRIYAEAHKTYHRS